MFMNKYIENNPIRKVRTKGIIKFAEKEISEKFRITAPNIAGIERRKENLIAFCLLNPKSIPVLVVEPERDIPGIKASAWESPIMNVFFKVGCLFVLGFREAVNKNNPVIMKPIDIKNRFENKDSIVSLNK